VVSIDALCAGLRARGHDPFCIAPAMPHYRDDDDGAVVRVPSLPLPTATGYRLMLPHVSRRMRERAAQMSIVHAHSPFVAGSLAISMARRARVPLVFTYHTRLEHYAHYVPIDERLTRDIIRRVTLRFAEAAHAVITPTAAIAEHLRSIGVRRPIAVIPSGIDVARFAAGRRNQALRKRFGVAEGASMVLWVGRLAQEKNVDLALETAAALGTDGTRTIFVGDGPQRELYEARARALGAGGAVVFAGELSQEALPDAYASADALLFTSVTETQGLVLAEALATGLGIVAVDAPTTREVVGRQAQLTPPSPAELASAVRALLASQSNDSDLRARRQGDAARFDRDLSASKVLRLYETVLAG